MSIGRLVVTVAASIPLAIELGVTGAAIGLALGSAADLALRAVLVRPQLTTRVAALWPARQWLAVGGAAGAGFVVSISLVELQAGPWGLLAAVVLGAIAYGAGALGLGGLLPRDRDRLNDIRARLRSNRIRGPLPVER